MLHYDFRVGYGSSAERRQAFGKNLRKLRLMTRFTIKDLAELSEIYPSRYSDYERAARLPTAKTLEKISTTLSALGFDDDTLERLERCYHEAVDNSSSRTVGRIRREF